MVKLDKMTHLAGGWLKAVSTRHRAKQNLRLNRDMYSSGQVESKLWLCRKVENLLKGQTITVWVLGGWNGLLPFLLLSREQLNIKEICSFDQDPACKRIADTINENWIWKQSIFQAETIDCNLMKYKNFSTTARAASNTGTEPDLIINTSVEHFQSDKWWTNIPHGKTVALQSCDMKHKEHTGCIHSEKEFKERFPSTEVYYSGALKFDYRTWSFTRYMLIVKK